MLELPRAPEAKFRIPPSKVVGPVYELVPLRARVPLPAMVNPKLPVIVPPNVVLVI